MLGGNGFRRQVYGEDRTAPIGPRQGERAAVRLRDPFGDGKTQPGAAGRTDPWAR